MLRKPGKLRVEQFWAQLEIVILHESPVKNECHMANPYIYNKLTYLRPSRYKCTTLLHRVNFATAEVAFISDRKHVPPRFTKPGSDAKVLD